MMNFESPLSLAPPLDRARAKLAPPAPRDRTLGAVAAAALFAISALAFAAVAILEPPIPVHSVAVPVR
jgi:hypothetical protein